MNDRFGPGVGHLNYLALLGVGIFEFLFVPVTTNHFLGGEFQLYLTSHFCPGVGNLTAIFGKCQNPALCPASPPAGLTLIGALSIGSAVSQLKASELVLKRLRKYHVCHLSQGSCVFYPVSD